MIFKVGDKVIFNKRHYSSIDEYQFEIVKIIDENKVQLFPFVSLHKEHNISEIKLGKAKNSSKYRVGDRVKITDSWVKTTKEIHDYDKTKEDVITKVYYCNAGFVCETENDILGKESCIQRLLKPSTNKTT